MIQKQICPYLVFKGGGCEVETVELHKVALQKSHQQDKVDSIMKLENKKIVKYYHEQSQTCLSYYHNYMKHN